MPLQNHIWQPRGCPQGGRGGTCSRREASAGGKALRTSSHGTCCGMSASATGTFLPAPCATTLAMRSQVLTLHLAASRRSVPPPTRLCPTSRQDSGTRKQAVSCISSRPSLHCEGLTRIRRSTWTSRACTAHRVHNLRGGDLLLLPAAGMPEAVGAGERVRTGSWAGYSSSCFHVLSVLPRQTGQGLHCRCRAGLHVAGPHLAAARLDTHSARQLAGNP